MRTRSTASGSCADSRVRTAVTGNSAGHVAWPFNRRPRLRENSSRHANCALNSKLARPAWPQAALLQAQLAERMGDQDQAIRAYQAAVNLGERGIGLLERPIRMLYDQRRFAEAERYLSDFLRAGLQVNKWPYSKPPLRPAAGRSSVP